ncbi:MAG TPA: outer membrane beta-barrel protein [Kofleriaceae bacterium]|nr:outer membrane beta-barrel protein [Kofleriaceae bacterium]
MKLGSIYAVSLALLGAGATLAAAQPIDDAEEPTLPSEVPAPEPTPAPAPPPAPVAATAAPVAIVAPPPTNRRPEGFSVGIGFGYDLPADVSTPNATSVRFRLGNGLTFEPLLVLGRTSETDDDGVDDTTDTATDLGVAVNARYPLRSRGRVDLLVVGGVGFGQRTIDPEGGDNETTTSSFAVSWGLGLDYWIGPHWQFSLTATNPLLQTLSVDRDLPGVPDTSDSTTSFGLIFEPDVLAMVHLYY